MTSDITRDTFHPSKHFSRVISQQGRVTLDADSNEQTSILLHYLRTLALDLIGPYAAPVMSPGFALASDANGLSISAGRYYVNGILVENDEACLYTEQPYLVLPDDDPFKKAIISKADASFWVYLDVWERHVTSVEDGSIREPALGGPDTCSRAQVAWQVKALELANDAQTEKAQKRLEFLESKKKKLEDQLAEAKSPKAEALINARLSVVNAQIAAVRATLERIRRDEAFDKDDCSLPLDQLLGVSNATMGARLDPGLQIVDACITSPDSKYRGAENQLYRVEIHRGGIAGEATFKWSRENGSVASEWLGTTGFDLQVANARGFSAGNWVELMDDVTEWQGRSGNMARLTKVQGGTLTVDKETDEDLLTPSKDAKNPRVRRWDQFETEDTELRDDGSILIRETPIGTPDEDADWIDLEDGIQIQFAEGGEYRAGDYWLIPARVATGSIEWPPVDDEMTAQLPPNGVVHNYAPLSFAVWSDNNLTLTGCDCTFTPKSTCFKLANPVLPNPDVRPNAAPSKRAARRTKKGK